MWHSSSIATALYAQGFSIAYDTFAHAFHVSRRLPTPPEWGPPPAHIFTSWYQPQTIPQPVFRPSSYSRLAAAYGGAQPPGYFPPAYLASAYGGAYGGGGPAAALPGVGTSLYPLVSDPLAAAGVLLEQSAPAPQMSERRLRAVLAAHAALAAEGNSALPRFAALASASEKGEADFEDATAGADAAFVAEHELMQRHLRRQRRYRRPAR